MDAVVFDSQSRSIHESKASYVPMFVSLESGETPKKKKNEALA